MAPKRTLLSKSKKAKPTPALTMMVESSPDRAGPSRSSAKVKGPMDTFAFQRPLQSSSSSSSLSKLAPQKRISETNSNDLKGKQREETIASDMLWCDFYRPVKKVDLAIHKKKVEQVEGWLRDALDGSATIKKYRRILALSGPAGSGKSSLVKILSDSENLDFQIVDWKSEDMQSGADPDFYWDRGRYNEDGPATFSEGGNGLLLDKFGLFLSSASRYSTLAMKDDEDEEESSNHALPSEKPSDGSNGRPSPRRVILLEDLPNISHLPTRSSFNQALEAFLMQSGDQNIPLILIFSDSIPRLDDWGVEGAGVSCKDRNDATLTIRSLAPPFIRRNPGFTHIEFNSIAPTILTKALKRVLELARPCSPKAIPAPSSITAKELMVAIIECANGDVRSAINTLQVVCLKGDSMSLQERGVKREADGKIVKKQAKKISKKSIAAVNGKESALVLFHTVGKILYNKRVGDPDEEGEIDSDDGGGEEESERGKEETELSKETSMPLHWQPLARRKSKVDVEMLWRTMPVDPGTLQAFLHQNYTAFCNDVEECAAFSDNISLSEALRPSHEEWFHIPLTNYYNFLISVHGSLLSLPSPVPRNQIRKLKGASLFTKMKEWRENTETLLEVQASLKEEVQERLADEFVKTTLLEASTTNLLCELLPLISKIHSSVAQTSIKRLVDMPWKNNQFGSDEVEWSDEEMENTMQESSDLQDALMHLTSSKNPVSSNSGRRAASAHGLQAIDIIPDTSDLDEDDEIEESD